MTDLDTSSSGWPTFPSEETLHEAYEVEIKTQNGETVRFGELIAGKGDSITTIVIFVRHFFCIYDQDYVRKLAGKMHQELLSTVPPNARPAQVLIIGCGDHTAIIPYMEETTSEFPIYSDPSGKIYDKLQMKKTTAFTDPPPYAEHSLSSSFMTCLKQIWKRGMVGLKGGNWDQQGGEWIFVNGRLRYAHRMEASNDHLTADRLMEILRMDHQQRKGVEVVKTGGGEEEAEEEQEEQIQEIQGGNKSRGEEEITEPVEGKGAIETL